MSDFDPMIPGQPEGALTEFHEQASYSARQEEVHLLHRLHTIFRERYHWAAILGLIGAVAGAVGGYEMVGLKYTSYGQIQVEDRKTKVLYNNEENNPLPNLDAFVRSQAAWLMNRRVTDRAMASDEWKKAVADRSDAPSTEQFMNDLKVMYEPGQREISVSFVDRDPHVATVAVKQIIRAYQDITEENDVGSGKLRNDTLQELDVKYSSEVDNLKKRILDVASEFGTDNVDQVQADKFAEVNHYDEELQAIRIQLAKMPASGGGQNGQTPATVTPEDIAGINPQMRKYLDDKEQLEAEVSTLSVKYGPNYPDVSAAASKLDFVKQEIARLMARYQPTAMPGATSAPAGAEGAVVGNDLAGLRAEESQISSLYEVARNEAKEIGEKGLKLKSLKDELNDAQAKLKETKDRSNELDVESRTGSRILVISDGDEPLGPSNSKTRLQLAVMGALCLGGIGVGLVGLLGYQDRRLKTIDDARSSLSNLPMLGILPRLPSNLHDPQQAAIAAHCVHQIRTLVQIGAGRQVNQVIAVTSPAAETGKTSLTLALGLSFAACGSRTLMIDTDLVGRGLSSRTGVFVRERLGQILLRVGLINQDQLQDALAEGAALSQYLGKVLVERGLVTAEQLANALEEQERTSLGILDACTGAPFDLCTTQLHGKNLHILPSGMARGNQAVSLSPAAIDRLIAQARSRYDIVMLDTGPVPGSLEGSIVAAAADCVVLVVSQGDQRPQAEAATAHLRSVGARIAGLVFNRADVEDIARSVYMSASREQVNRAQPQAPADVEPSGEPLSSHFGPIASAVATFAPAQGRPASRPVGPPALPQETPQESRAK